jgi:hypothetical protein
VLASQLVELENRLPDAEAERLKEDEANLARVRGALEAATRENQPRVLPHPKVIEGFLAQLLSLLETDQDHARGVLKRYMPPLVLTPLDGGSRKISGGFDLEATLEPDDIPVRASTSRRDRLPPLSDTFWLPLSGFCARLGAG